MNIIDYNEKDIKFDEIVKVFLTKSIYDIKKEIEVPNINFRFNKNDYFLLKKYINDDELSCLINYSSDSCLTIKISDSFSFFKYLTDIVNETIKLFKEYDEYINQEEMVIYLLRRIWLRMGINDVNNIELFLKKQLEFIKDRTIDSFEQINFSSLNNYDVFMKTIVNDLWDETTRSMVFTIKKEDEEYELPHVLYDIDKDNTCYIYAVQSKENNKSRNIERNLYLLNKGIENPNVHPGKVCSMLLFIEELKKNKISKIIVPSMQVLSYRYHELLSKESKKNLDEIIVNQKENPNDLFIKNRVKYLNDWYNHVYNKEDKISYLKTEELINLFYRLVIHNQLIEITNEVGLQGDSMVLKLKK